MSHRITTQTSITNKTFAKEALKLAGLSYTESSNTLHVTSGDMRNASINLKTGTITGDTDMHNKKALGTLRKFYSEAQIRERCMQEGHTVEDRQVLEDGRIRLVCVGMFA